MQQLTHFLPKVLSEEVVLAQSRIEEVYSLNILLENERIEFDTFSSKSRKKEYLATRWLAKNTAQELIGSVSGFELRKNSYGRPFGVNDGRRYNVSIAHTDEHVLCGISPEVSIGIDMEPAKRKISDKLRARLINPNEAGLLQDEPTVRIWTIKEALVKLEGKGMRTNLIECRIQSVDDNRFTATIKNGSTSDIFSFQHQGNWLAVAWYREQTVFK